MAKDTINVSDTVTIVESYSKEKNKFLWLDGVVEEILYRGGITVYRIKGFDIKDHWYEEELKKKLVPMVKTNIASPIKAYCDEDVSNSKTLPTDLVVGSYPKVKSPIKHTDTTEKSSVISGPDLKNAKLKEFHASDNYCSDNKKEECSNMKNELFKDFGKVTDGSVALTMKGQIAVKRSEDEYVRYDEETETMENQMNFVLQDTSEFIFIMPVNEVEVGDIIKNNNTYFQILQVLDNSLKAVNIKTGSSKTIIKEKNIMGFNFYYKVTSLMQQNNAGTGVMNPMLMMLMSEGGDMDELLPIMMMQQGQTGAAQNAMNPMMLMMMMSKGKKMDMKSMLMLQMAQGGQSGAAMNPMMLAMMMGGDGDGNKMDMKTMMLMQMLSPQQPPVQIQQKTVEVKAPPAPKKPRVRPAIPQLPKVTKPETEIKK